MKSSKFISLAAFAVVGLFTSLRATPVTQTLTNLPAFNSLNSWTTGTLGSVSLASGTNLLIDMSSTFTVADQGWGGQDPANGVYAQLMNGSTYLGAIQLLAGTSHNAVYGPDYHTINFVASDLSLFNTALANIDWSLSPSVSIDVVAHPYGYPGWELHVVQGGSFSVTSDTVSAPDGGATVALTGLGVFGLVALRRKRVR